MPQYIEILSETSNPDMNQVGGKAYQLQQMIALKKGVMSQMEELFMISLPLN